MMVYNVKLEKQRTKYYHTLIYPERRRRAIIQSWIFIQFFFTIVFTIYYFTQRRVINEYIVLYKPGICELHYPIKYSFFTLRQGAHWLSGITPVSIEKVKSYFIVVDIHGDTHYTKSIFFNNFPLLDLAKMCNFRMILYAQMKVCRDIWWQEALYVDSDGISLTETINGPIITRGAYPMEHTIVIHKVFMGVICLSSH
jgi:hypothetical protein